MPEEAIRLVLKSRELPLLLKTETASKKAQKQTPKNKPKNNRDAFNAAPERLQKVEAWCTLFRTVLETGILLLAQPENPFSAPNEKFWEK